MLLSCLLLRSVDVFRTRLENAMSMRSVLGSDPRPNCLIIDEIDGAPAPSINFLVSLLQAKAEKEEGGKKGKKKKKSLSMNRPVICICNDAFVPALRPLRTIALVMAVPPLHNTRLFHGSEDCCGIGIVFLLILTNIFPESFVIILFTLLSPHSRLGWRRACWRSAAVSA